jgi:hypothetical protein
LLPGVFEGFEGNEEMHGQDITGNKLRNGYGKKAH